MNRHDDIAQTCTIRPCAPADQDDIQAIINAAAEAYRNVIPADRWHDPYMPAAELASELTNGVVFSGYMERDRMVGVMGMQRRHNVDLIRHAYILPEWQGRGIGSVLLDHLCRGTERPILIGTWRAAQWAIRFYQRHGFARVGDAVVAPLLRTYWTIPEKQIAASLVLALPSLTDDMLRFLMADARRHAQLSA